MKKSKMAFVISLVLILGLLVSCSSSSNTDETTTAAETTSADEETTTEAETTEVETASGSTDAQATGETQILVAAAASLKNAYDEELIPLFEEQNQGITVEGTYDSSGKLQTQIEEGLEADVFMSAATTQMNALDEEGLIKSDTIVNLLENKIVLIVPTGGEEGFSDFTDIVNADSIAIGDPESVPAGQYAEEALTNLGLWDSIQDRVSLGTNVTEVLNQVAAASADAGIVYATDAASMADQVTVIAEAPEGSLETPVIYPVAVVENTANEEAAKAFVDFLGSDDAMAIFESYGFSRAQ